VVFHEFLRVDEIGPRYNQRHTKVHTHNID